MLAGSAALAGRGSGGGGEGGRVAPRRSAARAAGRPHPPAAAPAPRSGPLPPAHTPARSANPRGSPRPPPPRPANPEGRPPPANGQSALRLPSPGSLRAGAGEEAWSAPPRGGAGRVSGQPSGGRRGRRLGACLLPANSAGQRALCKRGARGPAPVAGGRRPVRAVRERGP